MTPRRRNVIVGLVVLIGLGIVAWMILLFAGRMASLFAAPGLAVTFKTDRADGVTQGSTIYYRGVPAGRVTGVQLESSNQGVVIQAEINKEPPLPANLHPLIRTQSAFGNSAQIDLEVTGAPKGQLEPGTVLQATYEGSGLIPKEFTQLAEDFRHQQLIQHLDQTVISIQKQSDRAGQLLQSLQQIVGDQKVREDLRASLENIRVATESATRVGNNLDKFTVRLTKVSDEADATLSDVRGSMAKLSGILDNFQSVSNKINQGQGTAGLLVNDPKLYQGLVDTTKELNLTIASLQRVVQQWEQEGVTLKLGK
jgi:phospholipid/cholesterol/gamma-HCH transport system substrate-binding protein